LDRSQPGNWWAQLFRKLLGLSMEMFVTNSSPPQRLAMLPAEVMLPLVAQS
jgi:hypothetical protein